MGVICFIKSEGLKHRQSQQLLSDAEWEGVLWREIFLWSSLVEHNLHVEKSLELSGLNGVKVQVTPCLDKNKWELDSAHLVYITQ